MKLIKLKKYLESVLEIVSDYKKENETKTITKAINCMN